MLVTSTTTDEPVIVADDLAVVMEAREDRPLLVVDVAVPRDVDPAVAYLPGVSLLDMTDVLGFARAGRAARRLEVERVESLVAEEVERYLATAATRELAPLIGSLHDRAEEVRQAELDRFAGRLAGLTDRQREAVEALTRGIVGKLVHEPTAGLKEAAGTAQADKVADLLRALFRL
jgi:glutamyl-tRNA reductase